MPKFTKEFSDSIGFKSLGHFTSFVKEFNVLGAQIQNLFDEYFKKTCFESYQLIANSGIDPPTYQKKEVASGGILNELRNSIPIKKINPASPTLVSSPESESIDIPSENPSRTRARLEAIDTPTKDADTLENENLGLALKLVEQEKVITNLRRENERLNRALKERDERLVRAENLTRECGLKLEQNRKEKLEMQRQIQVLETQNTHHKKLIFSYKKDDDEIRDFMRKRLRN